MAYCRGRGIAVLARGVLAGGWLSESFIGHRTPQRDVHLPSVSLTRYLPILDELSLGSGRPGSSDWADWCKRWTLYQQLLLALEAVALKHGCTVANVAARWVMDKPGVAAILVGARDASHVLDNLRTFDVRLDAEDVALIERILAPMEGPRGDCGQLERKRGN